MAKLDIEISMNDNKWKDVKNIESITNNVVEKTLSSFFSAKQHIEVSVLLTNDEFIQKLNSNYRGKNKPTNVLSFPQADPELLAQENLPRSIILGDIVIALETLEREAKEQSKAFIDHYTHMLVHSCLHLMHYDHETDDEAHEMEKLEIETLHNLGIKNPYQIM